nr:methyl-accepting chemotaxis protein [Actinomycetota bacterium]
MKIVQKGALLIGALMTVAVVGESISIAKEAQAASALKAFNGKTHVLGVSVQQMQHDFFQYGYALNRYVLTAEAGPTQSKLAAATYKQANVAYGNFQSMLARGQGVASAANVGPVLQRVQGDMASFHSYALQAHAAVQAGHVHQAVLLLSVGNLAPSRDIAPALALAGKQVLGTVSKQLHAMEAAQRALVVLSVLIGLSVAGLTAAVAVGGARWVMRPICKLRKRLHEIAEGNGDLTHRVQMDRDDEFGELAELFNGFVAGMGDVIGSVATSAVALSASSEQLSATSAQLSGSAEETAGQAA